ncbi:glutathione peroxidase [Dasania sp. GY-MA-18]|uniref:Glutathione peroxidase n=1 Tax=Dasania phycosphaerae TaxID=2950436 RepID=A0A9J6RHH7_9GAMM|nr:MULTISPECIES: glutathione peroxidase [Dasania]MCR8921479.1 glutathione peroxidase [Dasania sp. GY-MA-18]MCZ0863907.1 glutathione peroxidase [Dasania phycosphaerae]MCZ0867635.1 glutathione peroxidase [Dasania phycosphaerae]
MKTSPLYDLSVSDIQGKPVTLADYRGQVLLIVNSASECDYTPQYQELELLQQQLQQRFGPNKFSVLAFPCDQFGQQEPGSDSEILQFCQSRYGVSFPLFSKIEVNGPQASPLYRHLKQAIPTASGHSNIRWNFEKFIVDKKGRVVKRAPPARSPLALQKHLAGLIQQR